MPAATREIGTLSVRLPTSLKARAVKAAEARKISVNTFVTRLIENAVQEAEEKELYDGYTALGPDPDPLTIVAMVSTRHRMSKPSRL